MINGFMFPESRLKIDELEVWEHARRVGAVQFDQGCHGEGVRKSHSCIYTLQSNVCVGRCSQLDSTVYKIYLWPNNIFFFPNMPPFVNFLLFLK